MDALNSRHRGTLAALYEQPVPSDIRWDAIEALFVALGGVVTAGQGSRRRVRLNGVLATFHRPHPAPVTDRNAVRSVRRFLEAAGVVR